MDCGKVGALLCALRREQGMTQRQVAARLNVSDKAVSKWERGMGCPDVNLLGELGAEVGDHAAGNVVQQNLGIDNVVRLMGVELTRRRQIEEELADFPQGVLIQVGVIVGLGKDRQHRFDRRLR